MGWNAVQENLKLAFAPVAHAKLSPIKDRILLALYMSFASPVVWP
jgi:hypothetical protein